MRRIKSKVVAYLVEKVVGEGYTGVIKQNTVETEGYIPPLVIEDVVIGGASFSGQVTQLNPSSSYYQWLTPIENHREIFYNIQLTQSSSLSLVLSTPLTTLYYEIWQSGAMLYSGTFGSFNNFQFTIQAVGSATSIDFSVKYTLVTNYKVARISIEIQ